MVGELGNEMVQILLSMNWLRMVRVEVPLYYVKYIEIHRYIDAYTQIYTYRYTDMHIYIYTYIHIYIHIYIYVSYLFRC